MSIRPTKDFTEKVSIQDKNILIKGLQSVFGSGAQITTIHSTRQNVLLEISYPEENRKQVDSSIESEKVPAAIQDSLQKCTDQTLKRSRLSGERENISHKVISTCNILTKMFQYHYAARKCEVCVSGIFQFISIKEGLT